MWLVRVTLASGEAALLLFLVGLIYRVWALTVPLAFWGAFMFWVMVRVLRTVQAERMR